MEKICVYTCITGDYDNLKEIHIKEENVDYICFTNNDKIKSDTWKIIKINIGDLNNVKLARKIKILGHPFILDNYDLSIWIDASVNIIGSVNDFVMKNSDFSKYSISVFKHSTRNCIYEEAKTCIKYNIGIKEEIDKQVEFFKSVSYPSKNGLIESGIIIRKHNDLEIKKLMKLWFSLVKDYSSRDQLSFNYAVWKLNTLVYYIKENIYDNKWFFFENHILGKKKFALYFDYGVGFVEMEETDINYYINDKKQYCISLKVDENVKNIRFDPIDLENYYFFNYNIFGNRKKIKCELVNTLYFKKGFISLNNDPQIIIENKKYKSIDVFFSIKKISTGEILGNVVKEYISIIDKLNLEKEKLLESKALLSEELSNIYNSKSWKIMDKLRKLKK